MTIIGVIELSADKYTAKRQNWLYFYRVVLFVALTCCCLFVNIWFVISPKSKTFFEFGIKTASLLESQISLISFIQLTIYGKKIAVNHRYLEHIDNELHDAGVDSLDTYISHAIIKAVAVTFILAITFWGIDYITIVRSPLNLEISFSFLLISFVNFIYNTFSNVVLTIFCFSVKNKFSLLNKEISDMSNNRKINFTLPRIQKIIKVQPLYISILQKIKIIKKSHAALIQACSIVNNSAGHKILIKIVFTAFIMTGSTYTFFNSVFTKSKENKNNDWIIILSLFWFIVNCCNLFSCVYLFTAISEEVRFNYICSVKL